MKVESQLKVQAMVDGELSPKEMEQMEALLASDCEARRLAEALRGTRDLLRENEPVCVLPESGEFHWSKIAREIERLEAADARPARRPVMAGLWRWLAPAAGLAAVVALVMIKSAGPSLEMALTEVHMASPDMGAMTFSDQQAGVTMIWLYDRSGEPFTDSAATDTLPPQ